MPVGELSFEDASHRADVSDPVYLEIMELVNNFCSWHKRYLWRFTGMEPANLQSRLNLYVYLSGSSGATRGGPSWKGRFVIS